MPRHTDVPGTLAVNKSLSGANLGKISRIYDQLNDLLREINNKDLSREQSSCFCRQFYSLEQ